MAIFERWVSCREGLRLLICKVFVLKRMGWIEARKCLSSPFLSAWQLRVNSGS